MDANAPSARMNDSMPSPLRTFSNGILFHVLVWPWSAVTTIRVFSSFPESTRYSRSLPTW